MDAVAPEKGLDNVAKSIAESHDVSAWHLLLLLQTVSLGQSPSFTHCAQVEPVQEHAAGHVPDVVYQPQEVISKQKVMKRVVNKVPRAVQKTRTVQKASTTYVIEAYTEQVTKMKPETKSVKKVRFIPQVVDV